ncbi:molybdopterin cofactor-binding domain-containing protein [Rhodobacteraceae bacterium nBUS_22]
MGRIRTIARRSFLVGSAAVVGGVVFGAYKLRETPQNPLTESCGRAALNPFVIIDQNGVTLIAPKSEMGQGIHTTWAALIAEELDLDWQDINVLHGPPAKAYYNSALMGMALPFQDYEMTDFKKSIQEIVGDTAKLISLQLTGGSTSAKDGFDRMRIAGASARETLKLAAAQQLGVSVDQLETEAGHVVAPDGSRLSYTSLAVAAAKIDPPKVALRDPSQWRYLGKTMPRIDMAEKVTGAAKYGSDIALEGLRFATVKINPKHAGMKSFDASAAKAMPGVEKIIDLGNGFAVVATNTWLAMQAAEAVDVIWDAAPYPQTSDTMQKAFVAALAKPPDAVEQKTGDADGPHKGTAVNAEYSVPWLAHASMEPMTATALFEGGKLMVWAGNQAPLSAQRACAEAVGIEPESVTLNTPYIGGSFGRRGQTDFTVHAARIAAAMPGTPIRLVWSREEDMRRDYYRTAATARFKGVVDKGTAVAIDGNIAAVSSEVVGPGKHLPGVQDQPYNIPNYRMAGHAVDLAVPTGYWRAVEHSFNCFFLESFIDEMAIVASSDPLSFRLNMLAKQHEPSAKVLETVAEMSNWGASSQTGSAKGVAFSYSFGTPVATVCEVVQKDEIIELSNIWIACDVGTALDPGNIEAQMVGGSLYGLSAALYGEITFYDGEVEQTNFPDYDAIRMANCPKFEVKILENNPYIGGVGEASTPPAAPALTNALFALTGQRARKLPLYHQFNL